MNIIAKENFLKKYSKSSDGKKGGLFVGKSHSNGGIPAIVVDTGQPIEVEGGEAIINKEATKKYWKELSKINQSAGNGNPIPPPQGFSDEVSQYSNGGKISKLAITQGTKHELEHSDTIDKFKKQGVSDKEVARKIALDHLKENPNYYKVLKKLKLKKGGEIVCRSCGWSWLESENPKGENLYKCHKCNSDNKNFYKTGGGVENKKEVYDEWKTLLNMSASELKKFLETEDGKKAGLTKEKADELGIGSGRESASWILKMKAVPYSQWSDTMWSWAKRQIGFIKRMSGNKGSLYEDNGNKTRKHTSLLIWGHNPEKFMSGGKVVDKEQRKEIVKILQSFGLTQSKTKNPLKEVSFDRFEKIRIVLQGGYTLSNDNKLIQIDYDNYALEKKYGKKNFQKILEHQVEFIKKIEQELKNHGFELYDYGYPSNYEISIIGKKNQKMADGGRTIAQTPAPKKDRIVGSEKNAPKSSESIKSAEKIVLSEQVLESIETILHEYNKDTSKKVDLNTAKAVVRRGMGAYSSSHRPTISGGKPNSRVAWGLSRLKAFLYKIENGKSKSGKYSQDNDLIDDLGYEHEKFNGGGSLCVWEKNGFREYPKTFPQEWQLVEWSMNGYSPSFKGKLYFQSGTGLMYIEKSDGKIFKPKPSNKLFWRKIQEYAKGNKIKAENKGGNCYEMAGNIAMGKSFFREGISYPEFVGTPYVIHAEVSGQGAISGLRYGHAWVEDDMFIYDFSNGRKIVFPKELYYAIGNVITKPPKYYKYTFDEARKKMLETGHYGSWDLKTESGL